MLLPLPDVLVLFLEVIDGQQRLPVPITGRQNNAVIQKLVDSPEEVTTVFSLVCCSVEGLEIMRARHKLFRE